MEEIEAKYRLGGLAELDALRERLRGLGARREGAVQETNVLFDRANGALHAADRLLRLRWHDDERSALLTYKGPASREGALKRREEREVQVADGATVQAILAALGYEPRISYAKQRETWRFRDTAVALDTLAFGHYCEIEGDAERVLQVAGALGLTSEQVEPRGYPSLAVEHGGTETALPVRSDGLA